MFARIRPFVLTMLAMFTATPAFAASHREAPLIANDPTADITDFYFFRSWQDPDNAILIMLFRVRSQDRGPITSTLRMTYCTKYISITTRTTSPPISYIRSDSRQKFANQVTSSR